MADELYLPQVDYTSRDYSAIRADLVSLIPNFAPTWTSRDPSDFGIVLLELFSYVGDLLNYNIDRAANEAFISTATQRETVLNIAKLLNYIPNSTSPATGTVTLSNYGTGAVSLYGAKSVNASPTTFTTASDGVNPAVTFTLDSDVTLNGTTTTTPTTITVGVTQGTYVPSETIGQSDGTPNQTYSLGNTGVMTGSSFGVTVNGLAYTKVNYTIDYGSTDNVFSVYTDGNGVSYLQFGDGISGRIPPNGSSIVASYRYSSTLGSLGNIGAGVLTGSSIPSVSVTNAAAFSGGTDPETTDSVRVNAPLALRTPTRPVSLKDYSSLAVQVPGVAKAMAIANNFTSVVLFVSAAGGNPSTSAFRQTVSDYFAGKTPPGTTLTVQDFTPGYPYLKLAVTVSPQYNANNVGTAVANAIYTLLSFDNVTFNDLIAQGDIYAAAKSVPGVVYVNITDMEKFTSVYSGTATVNGATSATTALTVYSNAGIWVGSKIYSVNGSITAAQVGTTINAVNVNGTGITLSTAQTFASNDVIVVESAGTAVVDIPFNVNEIPILQKNYIRVSTTGGTS